MKGTPVTDAEKKLHDKIAAMGCVACRQEGIFNPHVSIHHVYGRTRPNCHMHVLPLCEPHHQDNGTAIAVHPFKTRFEARYGKQDDLVEQQWASLGVVYPPIGQRNRVPADSAPKLKARKTAEEREKEKQEALDNKYDKKESVSKPFKIEGKKAVFAKQSFPKKPASLTKPSQESRPKAKIANASKVAKVKLPKPVKTAQQIEFEKNVRETQKKLQAEQRLELKDQARQQKAAFMEANKEKIDAMKEKAKAARKQFRDEMKKKLNSK